MKKLLVALSLCLFMPLQACAQELWKEGEHFVVINDEATAKPEVIEFFSFWCGHCYNFEPLVKQMKSKFDPSVEFKKVHVNFMGFAGPDTQNAATRAMMIARAMKQDEKMVAAIFNYIHVQRSVIANLNDLRNIFIVNGVDEKEFDKLAKSFAVNSMFQKNNKTIQQYRRFIKGVPTFIVNGKYQANFTRDMSPDDMIDLVVWLTKQS